jgi:hypothetical protein
VKLLVQSIKVGKNHEGGIEVRITYRFAPPSDDSQDLLVGDYSFVGSLMNGKTFVTPPDTPVLNLVTTVVK